MANDMFCPTCGTRLINGVCPNCEPQRVNYSANAAPVGAPAQAQGRAAFGGQGGYGAPGMNQGYAAPGGYPQPAADNKGDFGTPDERLIMSIGSGYMENFLSGMGLMNNSAAVTNKRVYYKGKSFSSFGMGVKRCKAVQSVDLKDITGIGIYSMFNLAMLILGIFFALDGIIISIIGASEYIWLPTFLVGVLLITIALITTRTVLRIDYAGGFIALNMRKFSRGECTNFHKAILAAKDQITDYR